MMEVDRFGKKGFVSRAQRHMETSVLCKAPYRFCTMPTHSERVVPMHVRMVLRVSATTCAMLSGCPYGCDSGWWSIRARTTFGTTLNDIWDDFERHAERHAERLATTFRTTLNGFERRCTTFRTTWNDIERC